MSLSLRLLLIAHRENPIKKKEFTFPESQGLKVLAKDAPKYSTIAIQVALFPVALIPFMTKQNQRQVRLTEVNFTHIRSTVDRKPGPSQQTKSRDTTHYQASNPQRTLADTLSPFHSENQGLY
jgi:hypothetical protein